MNDKNDAEKKQAGVTPSASTSEIGLDAQLVNAASENDISLVLKLIQSKANVNAICKCDENNDAYSLRSPLMAAAYAGHLGMVHFLVNYAAKIGLENAWGKTAYDFAEKRTQTLGKQVSEEQRLTQKYIVRHLMPAASNKINVSSNSSSSFHQLPSSTGTPQDPPNKKDATGGEVIPTPALYDEGGVAMQLN
jgi:hypothetical protein